MARETCLLVNPPGGISVGVVWASNPDNKAMYRNKSLPLALLMPLFERLIDLDLIELHSLQFGSDAEQMAPWRHRQEIHEWSNHLADFSDTAQLLSQLDLVITVDTAVAHLAGALNKPTWLLLPRMPTFVGCANGLILLGTHPCVCFVSGPTGIGSRLPISSMKRLTPCFCSTPRLW